MNKSSEGFPGSRAVWAVVTDLAGAQKSAAAATSEVRPMRRSRGMSGGPGTIRKSGIIGAGGPVRNHGRVASSGLDLATTRGDAAHTLEWCTPPDRNGCMRHSLVLPALLIVSSSTLFAQSTDSTVKPKKMGQPERLFRD